MSGGGFKTAYSSGVVMALLALNEQHPGYGRVVRKAGASAGAMLGFGCHVNAFSKVLVWAIAVTVC
jgi:hypothetical protein